MNEFEHNQEIIQSRVGALGGSDAAMVYRIGRKGINNLSNTDIKRLRVLYGLDAPEAWGGNEYTEAGHAFEALAYSYLSRMYPDKVEREYKMIGRNIDGIQLQAHADFFINRAFVVECKYSKFDTSRVLATYAAQLQWYYLLCAPAVFLYHGKGEVEPFECDELDMRFVEPNRKIIDTLWDGIELITEQGNPPRYLTETR